MTDLQQRAEAIRSAYPDAPSHLSERAAGLWRTLGQKHARSPGRQELLRAALEALDRAEQARQAIERDGLTTTTEKTGAVHLHPAARVERESQQTFARFWHQLGIDAPEQTGFMR